MAVNNEKVLFTHREDEVLVESVSSHPSIYDLHSKFYKDQRVKDNAWKEIEEQVGRTVQDCKKRWKNIKDTFRRRKTKLPTGSSQSSKPSKWALEETLSFLDSTEYKRKTTTNVDSSYNVSDDEHENDDITLVNSDDVDALNKTTTRQAEPAVMHTENECAMSQETGEANKKEHGLSAIPSRSSNKRLKLSDKLMVCLDRRIAEREKILKELTKEEDAVDVFFKSIALTLKKFHPSLIAEAKMKTLQIVNDLELQNSASSQSLPFQHHLFTSTPSPSPLSSHSHSSSHSHASSHSHNTASDVYDSNSEYHVL